MLLISGLNRRLGIADFAFVVGDTAVAEVVRFLMAMPILTLQASLCPTAATSTVFALVTSLQMAGATLGDSMSALVTALLGVTQTDFRALGTLTTLGAASQLLGLPLLFLIPNQAHTERDGVQWAADAADAADAATDAADAEAAEDAEASPLLASKGGARAPPESRVGAVVLSSLLALGTFFSVGECVYALAAVW
jgi:hypothetical protein